MRTACALLFVAAACVSSAPSRPTGPPGTVQANAGSGSDEVCHEVQDTGSLFSHTECESKQDAAARRDNDTRWLKQPTSDPSSMQGGQIGGGPQHH